MLCYATNRPYAESLNFTLDWNIKHKVYIVQRAENVENMITVPYDGG